MKSCIAVPSCILSTWFLNTIYSPTLHEYGQSFSQEILNITKEAMEIKAIWPKLVLGTFFTHHYLLKLLVQFTAAIM